MRIGSHCYPRLARRDPVSHSGTMNRFILPGLALAALAPSTSSALDVHRNDVEAFADVSVYVTETAAFADCLIHVNDVSAFADGNAEWYWEDTEAFADVSVYLHDVEAFADVTIAFTEHEAFAECDVDWLGYVD